MPTTYQHLSSHERDVLAVLRSRGQSLRQIAAIFVTDRVWTPEHRFRYVGKVLLGREHERLPGQIWLALNIEERFTDILGDWN